MFIKRGDGKIMSIIDEEDLTDEHKKAVKDLNKQVVKPSSNNKADTSQTKKSGS